MKSQLHNIQKMVGHFVSKVIVELYLYKGDEKSTINDAQILFDNGFSVVVGCSGDGSIFAIKGEAQINHTNNDIIKASLKELENIHRLELKKIEIEENSLTFFMVEKKVSFVNEYDELVIYIDNKEVSLN